MHSLLKIIAGKIATDHWMEMGARNQCDANAALTSRLYREWGIGIARSRAHALLALHRDTFGGRSAAFAAQSRRCYEARQCAYHGRQGPHVQPPQRNGRPT